MVVEADLRWRCIRVMYGGCAHLPVRRVDAHGHALQAAQVDAPAGSIANASTVASPVKYACNIPQQSLKIASIAAAIRGNAATSSLSSLVWAAASRCRGVRNGGADAFRKSAEILRGCLVGLRL